MADQQPPITEARITLDLLQQQLLRPLGKKFDNKQVRESGLLTELHYDFSRDYTIPRLIGSFFKLSGTNTVAGMESTQSGKAFFPVVTSVKQVSPTQVEITRSLIYRGGMTENGTEVIRIDRAKKHPSEVVLESHCKFAFKEELVRLYAFGYMVKRQILNPESHPAFQDQRAVKLISDVFMYKNMKECNTIFKLVDPERGGLKRKASMDKTKELSASQIADLI
ncbi:hypothetical protein FGO68_gene11252 [Halteria grandinella]|uniref:Uncharacterized protein n=1 Tax=Halteria grandinella TaxID=5974 RepID=A0A8J8SZ54_HALGN|nr:hypothetical protein FGO68_gene11252 [Halteria grandinella]